METQTLKIEPGFIYGTAWKEELTETCVFSALAAGYRAIDTANQRKHYNEEGVGKALARAYSELGLKREDLFLQSKFTYARGQDHRLPYDKNAPLKLQVQQSFESSLQHLQTDTLDSYILHGPSSSSGLTDSDWETWGAMEVLGLSGKVKHLGISNVNYAQLIELYEKSSIKPTFVQNRCFAETGWDKTIREFCVSKKIIYQGFSLLTANSNFLVGELHPEVCATLKQTGKNIQQVIFRFAQQLGMLPITGTRSPLHMKSNLEICDLVLTDDQMRTLESIAFLD